jgi:hypothetical protein
MFKWFLQGLFDAKFNGNQMEECDALILPKAEDACAKQQFQAFGMKMRCPEHPH